MIGPDDNLEDDILEHLLNIGYIEMVGIDPETGENTYKITEEGKNALPDLHEEAMASLNNVTFNLWQKDMLDLAFDDNGMPQISLNENSYDEEKIVLLPTDERFTIRQFVQIMRPRDGII